jgi:UDP-N-acetyl-D-mannosaminuronic acid dehydrogenase
MARWINDGMPEVTAARIRRRLKNLKNPRILALGATYKPNTYDARESPAFEVVKILREDGYNVTHYDPNLTSLKPPEALEKMVHKFNVVVVLVEHAKFKRLLNYIGKTLKKTIVIRF